MQVTEFLKDPKFGFYKIELDEGETWDRVLVHYVEDDDVLNCTVYHHGLQEPALLSACYVKEITRLQEPG